MVKTGIAVCAALVLTACSKPVPQTQLSDEELALAMQCDEKDGLMAIARGPKYDWIACYQGKKRIWNVRLNANTTSKNSY